MGASALVIKSGSVTVSGIPAIEILPAEGFALKTTDNGDNTTTYTVERSAYEAEWGTSADDLTGEGDLAAALSAGEADIRLASDVGAASLRIPSGVTLDINGKMLTSTAFATLSGSQITDSSAGDPVTRKKESTPQGSFFFCKIWSVAKCGKMLYNDEKGGVSCENTQNGWLADQFAADPCEDPPFHRGRFYFCLCCSARRNGGII